MDLRFYWYKIKSTPLKVLVQRVFTRVRKAAGHECLMLRDRFLDTRGHWPHSGESRALLNAAQLDVSQIDGKTAEYMVQMWCSHRFDLLGSGWVRCAFADNAPGFEENRYAALARETDGAGVFLSDLLAAQNVKKSKEIWKLIDDEAYQPIDWQKDYKSGYRWDAKTWYLKQKWANRPGGDIKMPWELSRLQHLPRMAVFSLVLPEQRDALWHEFRNECLDFFAQNPPRMGVNWMCTMDVGIRTANLVLAYSLFESQGMAIDDEFRKVFSNAVYDHCHHIFHNLEWSEVLTSNHYLADICGLLFGAAFLPEGTQQAKWLNFARREVCRELIKQFHEEGSNFEGSTAYHRLSADMAAYSAALIMGLEKTALDRELTGRLYGAGKFLQFITRPDGAFSQVGDNDSGLFFRFSPTGGFCGTEEAKRRYGSLAGYVAERDGELYYDENMNDGRPTEAALRGLFAKSDFGKTADYSLERSVVEALCGGEKLECVWDRPLIAVESRERETELPFEKVTVIPASTADLKKNLHSEAFPGFGLYLLRGEHIYLLFNATDNGQNGNAGHTHNDKLSFELIVDGEVLFEDPGTYVYTASEKLRNEFRGVSAHNTIQTGQEQNDYLTPFAMKNETRCALLGMDETSICAQVTYKNVVHRRQIRVLADAVEVTDWCNVPFEYQPKLGKRTAGYGKMLV